MAFRASRHRIASAARTRLGEMLDPLSLAVYLEIDVRAAESNSLYEPRMSGCEVAKLRNTSEDGFDLYRTCICTLKGESSLLS